MLHEKKENTNPIMPAIIKGIPTSKGLVQEVLFSMTDVLQNKKLIVAKEDIMKEYRGLIGSIKVLLGNDKPSYAPRKNVWEAGNLIVRTRESIRNKYGVDITNMIEAVAVDLGISKRFIQYMVQFSKITTKEKVIENISWSNYQEVIDLINK